MKIGPWGRGYQLTENCDIAVAPLRLESITVNHGDVVDGLEFSYRDREKLPHTAGPWGGSGGQPTTVISSLEHYSDQQHPSTSSS